MLMIGIRQFFTRQNFPNPDSSKFSTVKILRHTVLDLDGEGRYCSRMSPYQGLYTNSNLQANACCSKIFYGNV